MARRNLLILLGAAVVVVIGGVILYNTFLGATEEASGPISAIPLDEDTASDDGGTGDSNTADVETGMTLYSISQDDSEATFTLSEVLRGEDAIVVGTTNQVAGEIAVNPDDLSTAQVGTIQVNARTLVTDESRRNQMIRNQILNTNSYEFVTFAPTEIVGLSGSATPGQEWTFQIVGDLTIRDITNQVTFDVTAQIGENGQLVGTAATTVNRSDFNLNIPSVPFVADVGEEVTLSLDFAAPEA
ncbi:MAG: YceI family protein [Candidatus Promineifilaceae bacterium]